MIKESIKIFEAKFLNGCFGENLADFLQCIHREGYRWKILEIEYLPSQELQKASTFSKATDINNHPDAYEMSIEELVQFSRELFQVIHLYLIVYFYNATERYFSFEVVDGWIASIEYQDDSVLETFKNATQGWIDIDHPIFDTPSPQAYK